MFLCVSTEAEHGLVDHVLENEVLVVVRGGQLDILKNMLILYEKKNSKIRFFFNGWTTKVRVCTPPGPWWFIFFSSILPLMKKELFFA